MNDTERKVAFYDPAVNEYDLTKDPRCLWGWGGCCTWGHACFRPYQHPGRCWDAGDKPSRDDSKCHMSQRPKRWDDHGRSEASR